MNNRRSIVFSILILVCISLSLSTFKNYEGKNIEEIKEKTNKNDKLVFHVQQDNGSYTEQTSGTFPNGEYLINIQMTKCVDKDNVSTSPTITYQNGTVTVSGNNTVYCEIYFDKCKGPVGTQLQDKEQVSKCEVGGMYRYQGTDNVNNYICFGTTYKSTCTSNADKYMYRIIGVTPEGQLKLIKETVVKEETETTFQWNDKSSKTDCGSNGSECNWANSKIYNRLNGLCKEGNANCTGVGEGSTGQTNIFINSEYYDYLTSGSTWESKISNHIWKHGDTNSNFNNGNYNGDTIYAIEDQFSNNVEAKIGLQYIHDYYYAYPGGNPGNMDNAKNAWIHFRKDDYNAEISTEWLISKIGIYNFHGNVDAYNILYSGNVYNTYYGLTNNCSIRPVFYLTKDTTIKSGTGSNIDPYILDVVDDSLAPTCHFEITNAGSATGVKLVHDNASSWYVSQSPTNDPQYGTSEYVSSMTGEKYYGYVKNDSGKTGKCELEMYQAKVNYCTTKENHTEDQKCACYTTVARCECNLGNPYFYYSTGQTGLSQCPDGITHSLPSVTCQGDFLRPCGEFLYDCTCECYGGTTSYTCSDNSTCTESGCCEKKSCGVETCQSGYETYTIDKDSIVYCYKNIS